MKFGNSFRITKSVEDHLYAKCRYYQSSSHQCHLNARVQQTHLRPLQPHDPVGLPFVKWGIDFIHGLPETPEGEKNIFSAKCYATKRVILIKTKDRTARTAARCIFKGIVCKFGVPLEIVCDRASAFSDEVLQEYLRLLEFHQLPTAAFTPRSNGSVERRRYYQMDALSSSGRVDTKCKNS